MKIEILDPDNRTINQKWNELTSKWLAEEVESRGIEWVLEAIFARRDQEECLSELAKTIKRHEKELTALGIQFPGGGQLLFPVATEAIKKLVAVTGSNLAGLPAAVHNRRDSLI